MYLARAISLQDLDAWIARETWDALDDADPATVELIGEVELSLAEYTSGHADEHELRADLAALVTPAAPEAVLTSLNVTVHPLQVWEVRAVQGAIEEFLVLIREQLREPTTSTTAPSLQTLELTARA